MLKILMYLIFLPFAPLVLFFLIFFEESEKDNIFALDKQDEETDWYQKSLDNLNI